MGLLTTLTRHNVLLLLSLCTRGLSFESSFVHLSGVRHHIRDTGNVPGGDDSSPVAVLFHGFAGSCASWEEVAPMSEGRSWHTLVSFKGKLHAFGGSL